MADQKQPRGRDRLNEDELVKSLAPDPSAPPDARVMVGFLGKSVLKSHWRLYLTPNLNDYVEFDEADILHSRQLEGSDHPLGGTVVWLKREANIVRTRSASREAQADFLQGDIAARIGAAQFKRRPASPVFYAIPATYQLGCPGGGNIVYGSFELCPKSLGNEICPGTMDWEAGC